MKLKTFLIVVAAVSMLFAIALISAPAWMDMSFGTGGTPGEILSDRMLGSALLGFAVLFWMARNFTGPSARPVIVAGLVGELALFIVSLSGMINSIMDATGWITVVISLLFAVGFGYYEFVRRPV